jgi:hypothetical protein
VKKLTIAALVAAQMASVAQPASATDLVERDTPRMGAFAGARLRIPLDGARSQRRPRAALTLAPTMRMLGSDGTSRLTFGEGIELGIAPNRPLELSFAGQRMDRIGDRRAGVSTVGWIAIGVGTIVLAAAVGTAILVHEINENSE